MKALIDADIIAYRFAFLNEFDVDFSEDGEEPCIITVAKAEEAMVNADDFIKAVVERSGSDDYVLCLSSKNNFRYTVMPTYKNNRNASTVPTLVDVLKNYMQKAHPCLIHEGLEADDVMSLLQTDDTIICTIDKDLDQVEGLHYNWNKIGVYEITEEEGARFFYRQILMGDPTDGYKGCPKIGKVKSQRIVDSFYEDKLTEKQMWEAICSIYVVNMKRYTDEDTTPAQAEAFALQNARVARMLRGDEYTFETETVNYWLPEGGLIYG